MHRRRAISCQRSEGGTSHSGQNSVQRGRPGNQAVQAAFKRGHFQAKLEVSSPSDPAEREAERVASEVVRLIGAGETNSNRKTTTDRSLDTVGPDTSLREGRERVSRGDGEVASIARRGIRGAGRALSRDTRSKFEPVLQADLSGVRVHTNHVANESARSIGAAAYTMGSDIAFAPAQFKPHSGAGRELLAHELTHILQQAGDGRAPRTIGRRTVVHRATDNDSGDENEGAGEENGGSWGNPLTDMSTVQAASPRPSACNGLFGEARGRSHNGLDYYAAIGTSIYAVSDGVAVEAVSGTWGDFVRLYEDSGDTEFFYAHLKSTSFDGRETVTKGDKLGETGVSGNAEGPRPHLHFEVHPTGYRNPEDPLDHGFPTPTKQRVYDAEQGWHTTDFDISDCDG